MRHRLRVTWLSTMVLFGPGALFFSALLFVPTGAWHNVYCPVDAVAKHWSEVSDGQQLQTRVWFGVEEHVIQEGRLFLRVQSTAPSLIVVCCAAPRWDSAAIVRYRAAHPELETLWRSPSLADGGVRWLKQ